MRLSRGQGAFQLGDNPIENMRARAEQCRRLSDHMHDRKMAEQLRTWAREIEADIRRLEAGLPGSSAK